jgi:hypothetical protein
VSGVTSATVDRIERNLGELLARHRSTRSLASFARYRDDPVGFLRDVLHEKYIIPQQIAAAESVRDHRQTMIRGCQGSGKDHLAARLALWWVYARQGLAILSGPTDRQVGEILVRRNLKRAFTRAGDLPGELYARALHIEGHEESGILAFTANDPDAFTGHHSPGGVLVILTEAQGIEDGIFEAADACMAGSDDRELVLCNPVRVTGRVHAIHSAPEWSNIRISAFDHPNVIEGREVIKGAVTREFVEQIRATYGENSPQYVARVLAEFPKESVEQLIRAEWVDRAVRQWKDRAGRFVGPATIGADIAHMGPDSTVAAVFQGDAIRELRQWRGADTSQSAEKLKTVAKDVQPDGRATIVCDATGLGWGTHDALKAEGWPVVAFVAAQSAKNSERFANARAEAGWLLREALEAGRLPLPPDSELREELLALTWGLDAQGRVLLDSKDIIRARLRRSPDKSDAVSLANWATWRDRKLRTLMRIGALGSASLAGPSPNRVYIEGDYEPDPAPALPGRPGILTEDLEGPSPNRVYE